MTDRLGHIHPVPLSFDMDIIMICASAVRVVFAGIVTGLSEHLMG